jgi:hypothetical protein
MRIFKKRLHFLGKTFFASYRTQGSNHDRMMFIEFGLDERGFFDWVQKNRLEIEEMNKCKCVVVNCKII